MKKPKQPERKSIAAALTGIMGREARQPAPSAEAVASYVPRSRVGKKALLTHHDPAVLLQLKSLALEQDTTQQRLISEALNMLFVKYGKPPISY